MTPKEKAKELFYKFWEVQEPKHKIAKKYALIAVDEILNSNPHSNPLTTDLGISLPLYDYWQEVKQEIENL